MLVILRRLLTRVRRSTFDVVLVFAIATGIGSLIVIGAMGGNGQFTASAEEVLGVVQIAPAVAVSNASTVPEPDLAEPDVAEPDLAEPDVAEPDLAVLDLVELGLVVPDSVVREPADAVAEQEAEPAGSIGQTVPEPAGSVVPERVRSEPPAPVLPEIVIERAGAEQAGAEQAQAEQAGAEQSGAEQSGAEQATEVTLVERGHALYERLGFDAEDLGYTISFHSANDRYRGLTFTRRHHIEVYIRQGDSDEQVMRVIAHELGHAVDHIRNTNEERERWREQRGMGADLPWWPGSGAPDLATPAGDFAECFASWLAGSTPNSSWGDCRSAHKLMAELAAS